MGKFFSLVVFVIGFMLLVGCSTETAIEKKVEGEETEAEEIMEEGPEEKKEEVIEEVGEEVEEDVPTTVDVIDPNTEEVIMSFIPEEMGFEINDEAYLQELKKWAKELARGTEEAEGYDQRMYPDKVDENGEIMKGNPRVILEEAELVERVMAASKEGGTVELPIYVTESGYSLEEVPHLEEVVVASYTTYFNSSVAGRTKNIELSAEAINNVILGVGDTFSFNTTVGPSDEEHGYQKAMEAVNGKLVEGIGGGICQTSSTLFNAVDQLNVDYVERHNHSVSVGYVPHGRDATVSYGGLDFRFKNTAEVPLLIKAFVNGGTLTVEVRTSEENQAKLLGEV